MTKTILAAFAAFTIAAPPLSAVLHSAASYPAASFSSPGSEDLFHQFKAEAAPQSGSELRSFAVGPGLVNLSPGDSYATYQWGLKNDGEFQMIELIDNFKYATEMYRAITGDNSISIPNPVGPDAIEMRKTKAAAGIDINIRPAWDLYEKAQSKRDVTVAVIDTGIDTGHPDLQGSMWVNQGEIPGDGIDNDGNGYIDDVNGWNFYSNNNIIYNGKEDTHGTHAAGTIAAGRNNGGIAGIADNTHVKIMSLKALGGNDGAGNPASVIEAIHYAEANGASICNLSFGSSKYNEELAQVIQNSPMLFIVAAGNGDAMGIGYNIDQNPVYPASFSSDNIISVGNLLFDGSLDTSSNYGPGSVDIAAPGTYIVSTTPENSYEFMSGTSMAAPMVTGAAAMLYSYRLDLSLADLKNVLLASSRKSDLLDGKVGCGGFLDVYSAFVY
ncbi:MAG: S8 family serine peptidase [Clostridiaceae bacterium]|nr:S8 family serine peptidase [Clostridiaceae bacterium]